MKIFDLDSPLMNVLNKMADLMWLNILTLICCIPVITAGAALTSMHYVYDDFAKMQFQVGEIISCEAVPKSKKLLCSQVKIGSQVRQIVSGIKAHYSPEEMVGKKVMVLVNLKPAKLAGVMSEGMILCAEDAEGNLALVTPEKNMPAGAEIC